MLTTPEKELIRRLLVLVNFKTISDPRRVERLAANIPELTGRVMSYGGDLAQPRAMHAELRKALSNIASRTQTGLNAAVRAVNENLMHVQTGVHLTQDGDMLMAAGLLGCDAIFWYGVALIIDRRLGVRDRLAQCGAPGCGRFVLTFVRGRPQRHCNETHRRKADAIESPNRSQTRRDKTKAEKLLRKGESIDYVRGMIPNLEREVIERIAERVRARSR